MHYEKHRTSSSGIPTSVLSQEYFSPGYRPRLSWTKSTNPEWWDLLSSCTSSSLLWLTRQIKTFEESLAQLSIRGKSVSTRTALAQSRDKDPSFTCIACTIWSNWAPDMKKELNPSQYETINTKFLSGFPTTKFRLFLEDSLLSFETVI